MDLSNRRFCPPALPESFCYALLEGKGFLQEAPDGCQLRERIIRQKFYARSRDA